MYNSNIPTRAELPTTRQLVRSTLIAIVAAGAVLVTAILPGEYGIDPTGIGRLTGLTEMGEIKEQLAEEARADRANSQHQANQAPAKCSSILGTIFAELFIGSAAAHETGHGPRGHDVGQAASEGAPAVVSQATGRKDEMSVTLKPGQGTEIKLRMKKGDKVNFSWTTEGGPVNFDLHGDGVGGLEKSYEKGRAVKAKSGVLEAAFDGNHGWFWRNRTRGPVTVTLRTDGAYADIKQMK